MLFTTIGLMLSLAFGFNEAEIVPTYLEHVQEVQAQELQREDTQSEVERIVESHLSELAAYEKLYFSFFNLSDGANYYFNAMESYHPASVIKTLYLYTFLREVEAGNKDLSDTILFLKKHKYNDISVRIDGSGILQYADVGTNYTWEELLTLMITESDNVATSMVMSELGLDSIEEQIEYLDLEDTTVPGVIYTKSGRATRSSAADLNKVLLAIDSLPEEYREIALDLLHRCHSKDRIPLDLPSTVWVGNKTGTLPETIGDSAIIKFGENETYYLTIFIRQEAGAYIHEDRVSKVIASIAHDVNSYLMENYRGEDNDK